jgi:2-oxoglutarate ferredoxin oxidoreductase subunit gamma
MLAGKLLAAAAVYDGKNAVQTQSYGPEARGGKSKTDVVVSSGEIDYPKATRVDVLLAMTRVALDEYLPSLKDDGILVVDSYLVEDADGEAAIKIPFTMLAIEECGRKLFANVVALGAVAELTQVVTWENLRAAVLERVPKGTERINEKALSVGRDAAREATRGG